MRVLKFRAYSTGRGMTHTGIGLDSVEMIADEEHIMQYTGLKDKNGVEIYEGDIIKLPEHVLADNHEVSTPHIETKRYDNYTYSDGENGLRIIGHELINIDNNFGVHYEDYTDYYGYRHYSEITRGEVIGNIYENPELLK